MVNKTAWLTSRDIYTSIRKTEDAKARKVGSPAYVKGGKRYMPLKLKAAMRAYRLQIAQLQKAVMQSNGKPLSPAAASRLLNWDAWPENTDADQIKSQVEDWLRGQRVPDRVIADVWDVDDTAVPYGHGKKARRNARRRHDGAGVAVPEPAFEFELPESEMLTQAAKRHFNLFRDPFLDDVQGPDDVYLSADQRYIREAMYQASRHGGFLAVVGESGAGKSTLRKDLIERIRRDGEPLTIVQPQTFDKRQLTALHIADAIISDLSAEAPKRTLEAKARQVQRLLTGSSRAGNDHVLIIEEAHDLAIPTLKYLKRFWELEDGGFKRLLAIVLIGQPELKDKLNERINWEAREVIRRCEVAELQPLNGNLEEYLALKFKRVGKGLDEVFAADAYDAIRTRLTQRRGGAAQTLSMMYPLVVNNAVRKAMNLAAQLAEPRVSGEIVMGV